MTGKRPHIVWLLGLVPLLNSCGTDTPAGAAILAVEPNSARTVFGSTSALLVDTVHFKVQASPTNPGPVGNAEVDVVGNSPVIGDTASAFLTGVGGAVANPGNPNQLDLQTNPQGVVTVFYRFTVPPCVTSSDPNVTDVTITALISASIGSSTATWRDDITVQKC